MNRMSKISYIARMATKKVMTNNLNIRVTPDVKAVIDYLKITYPGGISAWVRNQLLQVKVDEALMAKVQELKENGVL